ncbi:MAG TPA: serine--tRNA ligase [Bdellovibrionota bacterium]|nr:serine--tRNA ligase [Bdellovibrionota bacterium]
MLDWREIHDNPEVFKTALQKRGFAESEIQSTLAEILTTAKDRAEVQRALNLAQEERNRSSGEVAQLMRSGKKEEAQALIAQGKKIGEEIDAKNAELEKVEIKFRSILEMIPNLPNESVPFGKSSDDNKEVRKWGTARKFDFEPLPHDELAHKYGYIDFDRAGKISGSRFAFLMGAVAQLEHALGSFMLDEHRKRGYLQVSPPYLVSAETMYGIGQFPKFKEDVFKIDDQDKYLIPTAEVSLTSYFRDEILSDAELPVKFTAFTPSFRSEAGSYGKDTKGLIRQHQFLKVELVKFSAPETSFDELEAMVGDAENILQKLEIPYRTMLLCSGDMGFSSRKTYDIEVWLPGSVFGADNKKGCYREISSCSDCGPFQARRSAIRYKGKDFKGTRFVHTLNGSGLAVGRTLVAVLENYQNKDGSITVPAVLRPYMGGLERIEPVSRKG